MTPPVTSCDEACTQVTLSVIIEKDDSGFYAYVSELPGCQTQGDSLSETLVNVREVAELYLEALPLKMKISTAKDAPSKS